MSKVCDSLNMCADREQFLAGGGGFVQTPVFCPYCGKHWLASAISEIVTQPVSGVDRAIVCKKCGSDDITWIEYECNRCDS